MTTGAMPASRERQPGRGAVASRAAKVAIPTLPALFILSILLPSDFSFYAGALRLTPYRLLLLAIFIPAVFKVVGGAVRATIVDACMAGLAFWIILSLAINHGPETALESGGILTVEGLGPYFLARAYIRTPAQFRGVVRLLVWSILAMLPLLLIETVTGKHIIRTISATMMGGGFASAIDTRMGFHRSFGPFDHPIHLGVFCASAVGLAWNSLETTRDKLTFKRFGRTGGVAIAAVTSWSAGAMATIMTQLIALIWERATRSVPRRWLVMTIGIVAAYIFVDTLSNRSGLKVFLSYLTFSPATAYNRIFIWEWGFYENVLVHPMFGIGFNEWVRPSWMHSTSMDNFWLVIATQFGVPAFLFLAAACLITLRRAGRLARDLGPIAGMIPMGWVISFVGVIVAGATVHYWNNLFVYFSFLLGLGASVSAAAAPRSKRGRA